LKKKTKSIINIHSNKSSKDGVAGAFETFMRTYRKFTYFFLSIGIIFICLLCAGISLTPSILFVKFLISAFSDSNIVLQAFVGGVGISFGYFIYGVTLIFICPLANKLNPWKVRPWRGSWYSLQGIPWYYHNALTFLVRYTFLDFITPTPLK